MTEASFPDRFFKAVSLMPSPYRLIVFLLAAFPLPSFSQVVCYDVILAGRTIGVVRVLQFEPTADGVKRRIEAEFAIPFYSGSFSSENLFANGVLTSSLTEHKVKGKKKERTLTTYNVSQNYQVDFWGTIAETQSNRAIRFGISSTITNLYYEEPLDVPAVYSERYGQMCSVKKLGGNRYGILLPDGKQSIYSYTRGECSEVQAELIGMKLHIVRRQERFAKR